MTLKFNSFRAVIEIHVRGAKCHCQRLSIIVIAWALKYCYFVFLWQLWQIYRRLSAILWFLHFTLKLDIRSVERGICPIAALYLLLRFTFVSYDFFYNQSVLTITSSLKFKHLGHVTSLVTWHLDQQFMVSYRRSIITIRLSWTVTEIWRLNDFSVTILTFWSK